MERNSPELGSSTLLVRHHQMTNINLLERAQSRLRDSKFSETPRGPQVHAQEQCSFGITNNFNGDFGRHNNNSAFGTLSV